MDELRELMLAHLEELHRAGLLDSRYELYVDTIYRCEDPEELLAFADLELQLEASEFLTQLRDNAGDDAYDDADYRDRPPGGDLDEIRRLNSEGFGDDIEGLNFDSETTVEAQTVDTQDDGIDPELLALQRTLLGIADPETDPDYFDIDALLSGGTDPQTVRSEPTPEYQDALAALLAEYPLEDEAGADFESSFERAVKEAPAHAAEPAELGVPSGFFPTTAPSGFFPQQPAYPQQPTAQPLYQQPTAFGQPQRSEIPMRTKQLPTQPPSGFGTNPPTNGLRSIFSDFSKRKSSTTVQ